MMTSFGCRFKVETKVLRDEEQTLTLTLVQNLLCNITTNAGLPLTVEL